MKEWFAGVKTVEELRKRYRELLKQYHPDNENGSIQITQEINVEYDRLFDRLKDENKSDGQSCAYDENEENREFKEIINTIIHINAEIEIIGRWIWVHGGYEYRELLKSNGFRYAPKKKCWSWHFGEYRQYHKSEISLDDIRMKYGSQTVSHKEKQYALNQ